MVAVLASKDSGPGSSIAAEAAAAEDSAAGSGTGTMENSAVVFEMGSPPSIVTPNIVCPARI